MEFPLLGQQVAVDLANTLWVYAGEEHDALGTVAVADRWVRAVAEHPLGDGSTLAQATRTPRVADESFRAALSALRDDVRELLTSVAEQRPVNHHVLVALNDLADDAPSRLHATRRDVGVDLTRRRSGPARTAILAALAEDALLMAGPAGAGGPVLTCPGPGCLGIFVQDNPRRKFCSPNCANRDRVARHYARTRSPGGSGPA